MKTTKVHITNYDGIPIDESKALVWGNNAAWVCSCGELLANRTGDSECKVICSKCGKKYEIERAKNKSGRYHLGAAQGIKQKR